MKVEAQLKVHQEVALAQEAVKAKFAADVHVELHGYHGGNTRYILPHVDELQLQLRELSAPLDKLKPDAHAAQRRGAPSQPAAHHEHKCAQEELAELEQSGASRMPSPSSAGRKRAPAVTTTPTAIVSPATRAAAMLATPVAEAPAAAVVVAVAAQRQRCAQRPVRPCMPSSCSDGKPLQQQHPWHTHAASTMKATRFSITPDEKQQCNADNFGYKSSEQAMYDICNCIAHSGGNHHHLVQLERQAIAWGGAFCNSTLCSCVGSTHRARRATLVRR
ncbi:hypothetical protein JKP88DRAFT_277405 [Tribonema minus]|uniref:Uncharacterized protein n=1 Tax=Tribonema minus TaxID=303371 RepID=A0A836CH93_9STRA|nr:hypothetical protein JKP88DRAFT_277405 [Tribonema minus]